MPIRQPVAGPPAPAPILPRVDTPKPAPAKVDPPRAEPASRGTRASESARSYVVQKGDTLWSIAESKGVTSLGIADLNGIADLGIIRVGQTLRIPNATRPPKAKATYVVQSGDTMNRIASVLGIPRDDLLAENRMTDPDLILPGQALAVPD